MSDKQKTVLFWLGSIFGVVLIIYVLVSINKIVNTATTTDTISFSGQGKISAKPDVAVFTLSIITQAAKSKAAQEANAKKANSVTAFLKKNGIADKDIKTSGYNVSPAYSDNQPVIMMYPIPVPPGPPKINGYSVTQGFTVKVRDLDKAGAIADGIVLAGANQVSDISFQIDNPEKLKDQARTLAVADAKRKASEMESTVGVNLGKIVNFGENEYGYPYYNEMKASGMGGGGDTAPVLSPGENEITVSVSLTYQIK